MQLAQAQDVIPSKPQELVTVGGLKFGSVSDLTAQDTLHDLLIEMRKITRHMEVLTNENFSDVDVELGG